jgi:hypothetical protein
MLPVEVRVLHDIVIKDAQVTNTLAAQTFTDLAANSAGTDQDANGAGEAGLIKSGDQFLAVSNRKTRIGRAVPFRDNFNGGCSKHFW